MRVTPECVNPRPKGHFRWKKKAGHRARPTISRNGCGGLHCTEFDTAFPKLELPFRSDLTHIAAVKTNFVQGYE
jgi:hypothetical protein